MTDCVGEIRGAQCLEPARYRVIVTTPRGRRSAVVCDRCCALLRAEGANDGEGGLVDLESIRTLPAFRPVEVVAMLARKETRRG